MSAKPSLVGAGTSSMLKTWVKPDRLSVFGTFGSDFFIAQFPTLSAHLRCAWSWHISWNPTPTLRYICFILLHWPHTQHAVTETRRSALRSIHESGRGADKVWQCLRASLLDFLHLATQIHNDGDIDKMRKATIVFNELSPFWDDIFIPSKASKYSSDTVPHDNNGWIARDLKSHSGKKAP